VTAFAPDVSLWDPWRPEQVAELLAGVEVPWYVAGGWALDLFAGEERRTHADLEIGVPAARFAELLPAFAGLELFVVGSGLAAPLAEGLEDAHQTWIREPVTGTWRLDVFREPSDGDTWICRRDPAIRLPYAELIERTDDGIPYGRPEVVLLFKAKRSDEEKNRADFEAVLPRLGGARRDWLRDALEHVHPGHPWRAELEKITV